MGGERRGSSDPSIQCFANTMASVWVASGLWTWQVALPTRVIGWLVYVEGWAQTGNTCL